MNLFQELTVSVAGSLKNIGYTFSQRDCTFQTLNDVTFNVNVRLATVPRVSSLFLIFLLQIDHFHILVSLLKGSA